MVLTHKCEAQYILQIIFRREEKHVYICKETFCLGLHLPRIITVGYVTSIFHNRNIEKNFLGY